MTAKHVAPIHPSVHPPPLGNRPKNRLLAALPADVFLRLGPHLQTVPLAIQQVLYKKGDAIDRVYFVNEGVCSLTMAMAAGQTIEAAMVGDEGMLGIEAFFTDGPVAPADAFAEIPAVSAEQLSVGQFRRELVRGNALSEVVGRYAQAKLAEVMQTAACNALHAVNERCARWLLMAHDRMHEKDFHLSHECLANMLGVQRPTVSIVAEGLQQAGLIRYKHGRISVLDREGLEAASCECYPIIRAHVDHLRPE